MKVRPLVLAALAIAVLGASCGGGPTYTSQDLERLVTRPGEVPEGLVYARNLSGLADLEEFRGDPEGGAAMRDAGFQAAYTALIATPGLLRFFTLAEPGEKPPADGKLVSSAAVLFDDAEGAARALEFFEQDLRAAPLRGSAGAGRARPGRAAAARADDVRTHGRRRVMRTRPAFRMLGR